METDVFYNHVSEEMCDFNDNTNFDEIYASVDCIICILHNPLNNFCPIIKINLSHDCDKHKPWLMNEIKSLIKEKKNCIVGISGTLSIWSPVKNYSKKAKKT